MTHRIICHLMKGGVLRAMMGRLRTIPRLRKLKTSVFLSAGAFCNLVVAGDHHPPPQIALVLIAERFWTWIWRISIYIQTPGVKKVGVEEEGIPRVHLHKDVLATKLLGHLHLNSCFVWHLFFQGCINCAILPSGMGALGVSSEHVENMEMFSWSPT